MEGFSMIITTVPVVFPIVVALGYDEARHRFLQQMTTNFAPPGLFVQVAFRTPLKAP
jgi:hypothetical protein